MIRTLHSSGRRLRRVPAPSEGIALSAAGLATVRFLERSSLGTRPHRPNFLDLTASQFASDVNHRKVQPYYCCIYVNGGKFISYFRINFQTSECRMKRYGISPDISH